MAKANLHFLSNTNSSILSGVKKIVKSENGKIA